MSDLRPPVGIFFNTFGVAVEGGRRAIVAKDVEVFPSGGELRVAERRTVLDLRRDEWPSLQRGTAIVVAEGRDAGNYEVDSILADDGEVVRVIVR